MSYRFTSICMAPHNTHLSLRGWTHCLHPKAAGSYLSFTQKVGWSPHICSHKFKEVLINWFILSHGDRSDLDWEYCIHSGGWTIHQGQSSLCVVACSQAGLWEQITADSFPTLTPCSWSAGFPVVPRPHFPAPN